MFVEVNFVAVGSANLVFLCGSAAMLPQCPLVSIGMQMRHLDVYCLCLSPPHPKGGLVNSSCGDVTLSAPIGHCSLL